MSIRTHYNTTSKDFHFWINTEPFQYLTSFAINTYDKIKAELKLTAFIGCIGIFSGLLTSCGVDKPEAILEAEKTIPDQVDYNLHIKPILSDRCYACHGPDKNKLEAGLRLDTEDGAYAALEDGNHAITPGKLAKSAVFTRIVATDEEIMMPPPESNLKLTDREKALIIRWIEQGAKYKPHWSFILPQKQEIPAVKNERWAKNSIDHFIMAKLEEKGLEPAEEADRETLLRRVTFDLTGLPPSLEEIDDFLSDSSPDAYEKVVDRRLASKSYGERMAANWLDVARYADSHGYQDDGMRNMWPWRDWVIDAFNKNLPYDQFITWQLAGDLLPNPTKEQILATGFNRNHLQSQEGGIVSEEYRVEYVIDRTNVIGTAFLGLTVECARCHDHKYDPISQKEFYQIYSFFNNNNETGQIPYMGEAVPTQILTDEEADKKVAFIQDKIKAYEEKVDPEAETYKQGYQRWLRKISSKNAVDVQFKAEEGYYPLDSLKEKNYENLVDKKKPAQVRGSEKTYPLTVSGKFGKAQQLMGDGYIDLGNEVGNFDRHNPFTISLWVKILKDSVDGPIFSKSGGLFNGNRGYDLMLRNDGTLSASLNHTWPASSIEVFSKEKVPVNEWVNLIVAYDGSSKARGLTLYMNGKLLDLKIENDYLRQSMLYYGADKETWGSPPNLTIGKRFEESLDYAVVDEFRIFPYLLSSVEIAKLNGVSNPLDQIMDNSAEQTNVSMHAGLYQYYLTHFNQSYHQNFEKLTELRGEENKILTAQPEVMVMEELKEPRATHILNRGAYDAPGERVYPGTISAVMDFPDTLPKNRLGLAQWLTHPENPLTTRVIVNRYWQQYFGRGLVSTSADFGNQGEFPTHPELLDWLAVQFREMGWDVKAMQKLIVMSATYRQSSVPTRKKMEEDPVNEFLSRGPSYRLEAEMIRDNALAASGLLVREIGGPPVKPYQPAGLWEELATRNAITYVQDTGANLYRRSMYTIWKRTTPPPGLTTFDAAERSLCTVKRQKTSTPLQALILLNDPQFVEASRILSEKIMKEGGDNIQSKIKYGFRALTSQEPTEKELALLQKLYQQELEEFTAQKGNARKLLEEGDSNYDKNLPENELAAMTLVTNTIMNFDEAVFKR